MIERAIPFFAAFSLMAVGVSLAVGSAIALGGGRLARLSAAAQSRLLLAAALAPAFFLVTVFMAMTVDPTVLGCRVHLCLHEHGAGGPGALGVIIAVAGAMGLLFDLGSAGRLGLRARRLERALAACAEEGAGGVRVLPLAEPEAFVLGMVRPRIYVSRGLLEKVGAADLHSVLAHERAHVQRRDPLRRAIASFGLAFHAPGIAALIGRRLARAQEMAADAAAARAVSDPAQTAGALVRLTRLRGARPMFAADVSAATGADLEERVRVLLAGEPRGPGPRGVTLAVAALGVVGVALIHAHWIHTRVEALLRVLR